jgi:hypothetical protein
MLPKFRFFPKTLDLVFIFIFFCGRTMAMAAMKVVSARGLSGVGYPKKNIRMGSRVQFLRKPLFLGSDLQS